MNPHSWTPRNRRLLWVAVALLAVFTIGGFFVAPPILRTQLQKQISAALGRDVTIGTVRVNPYALSLTIEQLDIRRLDRTGTFAGWDRLYVNFDALASLGGTISLHAIELDGFHVTASIEEDGRFNFADILEKFSARASAQPEAKPAEPAKPLALHVGRLAVARSRIDFSDRSRAHPFATVLGPVSFNVTEFRTVAERGAPFHFEAVTEAGEKFAWRGALIAAPFSSRGEFAVEQLALPKYAAYYADRVGVDLIDGRLSAQVSYEVALNGDKRTARVTAGGVQLRSFKLAERDTREVVLDLPALDLSGLTADAFEGKAYVAAVRANGGAVAARRAPDGTINWQTFFPAPAGGAPSGSAQAGPAFDLAIGEVALAGFNVTFADAAAPREARLALGEVRFALKQFSLQDGVEMPVEAGFTWKPQGTFATSGVLTLKPELRVVLQTELRDFALSPLSPYLEQGVNARLTQGAVSFEQKVTVSAPADAKATVDLAGWLRVANLGLVDGAQLEELAGFAALELAGLKVHAARKLEVSLDAVKLTRPYARVVVRPDGSLNLANLVAAAPRAEGGEVVPAPHAAGDAPEPLIRVGGVSIDGGNFSFVDRSVAPQVRVALGEFGGTIGELSSSAVARAKVDLRGAVDGVGPVAVEGELDPLGSPRFIDLRVKMRNVDLVPLSPYSGKYAGFELARGKLALGVNARVEGQRLRSENVMTLGQFTFGAPVQSKDATGLPVRLGVALLKDLDGNIVIDLPVEGDLSDPSFRVGRVVMRVIVNLLTKAAASPFNLLGSMFGGGGDELAFQEFDPGASELLVSERAKLDTLVKALTNRPALSLGIEGGYDGPADTFALKRARLASVVRAKVWEERRQADPTIPPPEQLEISGEDYAAKLKRLFDEKFPPGTEFGTPLPEAPSVVAAPPRPTGLFKRVVRAITGADRRASRAAEVANEKRAAEHEAAVAAAKAAGLSLEEMTGRLAETMEVGADDLRALAAARAERVRQFLASEGQIAAERLFLTQPKDGQKENKGPRVFLSLQ